MSTADSKTETADPNATQAQQAVGQLLRETRKRSGLEIDEVARALRISQRYLEALEDGRNQDLPGATYAIGFVRSYGEYLKLDGEEIVRRYKAEAEVGGVKTKLTFPKPIPDSGVPGGAVLGLGVIVAAAAYGVWYWNSNTDAVDVVRVEPVPEYMAAQDAGSGAARDSADASQAAMAPASEAAESGASEQSTPQETASAGEAADEAPADEGSAVSAAENAGGQNAETPATEAPVTELPAVEPPAVEPPADEPTVAEPPVPEAAAVEEAQAAPAATASEVSSAPASEPATASEPSSPADAPTTEAPAGETPAAEAPAAAASTPPAAESAVPADDGVSRITVRAKSNSWIQIRDEALDRLLFTRLLREGDEYEVPDRTGLRLMTGNAGALELLVDGKAVPSIGEVGEVRRNVELDPEKLKSGTAVSE